ncbi:MAG: hypothetical protein Q8L87_15045, partial [Anaerolineales bacterium]|nr:hypothetical protein [Anaerolineales bacterium]
MAIRNNNHPNNRNNNIGFRVVVSLHSFVKVQVWLSTCTCQQYVSACPSIEAILADLLPGCICSQKQKIPARSSTHWGPSGRGSLFTIPNSL